MQQFMRIFVLAAAAAAAAAGDPLNVRPGLWETTSTGSTTVTGTPMGPHAATLNAMTPEQRARMEAALKRYASGQPTVRTNRSCVTSEQVAKGLENFTGAPTPRCKTEVLQKTTTDYRFRQQCSEGGAGQSAVEVTLHLDSPESATMTMEGRHASDGRTVQMSHKAMSKWISNDCGKLGKGASPR